MTGQSTDVLLTKDKVISWIHLSPHSAQVSHPDLSSGMG